MLDSHTELSSCGDLISALTRGAVTLKEVVGRAEGVRLNLCFCSALNETQISPEMSLSCMGVISK